MRTLMAVAVFSCLCAQAQPVPRVANPANSAAVGEPLWRQNLSGILSRPPASASVRDLAQLEQYMMAAMPYCTGLAPNDYESNRALARNIAAYLTAMNAMSRDAETRAAIARVSGSIAVFPCAYPNAQAKEGTPKQAPPALAPPPFSLQAPEIENIAAADNDTVHELRSRYEVDAANAAATWNNAETLRQSLAQKGMALNVQTSTSLGRFQLFFEQASAALRDHHWDDALSSLQAVESENQKVSKTVGR